VGYKICVDSFRLADSIDDNVAAERIKNTALVILFDIYAHTKVTRAQVKRLKQAHVGLNKLGTLLMLVHDLNYVKTNPYLELNSNVNYFIGKLKKIIKYHERKLKSKE
ncbi:hypothetical protein ACFL0V_06870, partial [Nanoarchaeota archaeon]